MNLPTSTILADHFLKCSRTTPQNDDFKTLTVANKAEVPILFKVTLILHTFIHGSTRTVVIPFAVANIKYNILGTPFFGRYVKTLDIEHMSLPFGTPRESRVNTIPNTAHKEKKTILIFPKSIPLRLNTKYILNQTPLKTFIFQCNLPFF